VNPTAEQLRRLLAFLPQIADGQEHPIAEVAERVGVDRETIARDLLQLSERHGDPPGWIEKVAVYIEADRVSLEAASHFQRPMKLTPSEARALELGLAVLYAESAPAQRAAIQGALDRLRKLAVTTEAHDTDQRAASMGTQRNLEHVPALREALRNRRRVAVNYHKGSGEKAERRTICPYSFVMEKGVWYLIAHCQRSEDLRIFRLDRIESIELLPESFERPDNVDVEQLLANRSAFVGSAPEKLKVRYSPRVARWIAEREQGTRNSDGTFEVEYPLADTEWAVRHVLQYGPEAEVISPDEVRASIVERLRAMTA